MIRAWLDARRARKVAEDEAARLRQEEAWTAFWALMHTSMPDVNRRVLAHEAEVGLFGHDEDGRCCLRARLGADE